MQLKLGIRYCQPELSPVSLDSPSHYILLNTFPSCSSQAGERMAVKEVRNRSGGKVHSMAGRCPSCCQPVTSSGTHPFFSRQQTPVEESSLPFKGKSTYICIGLAPHCEKLTSEAPLRYGSHSFYTANTPYLSSPCKRSPDGATTDSDSNHLIAGYCSFIDPGG